MNNYTTTEINDSTEAMHVSKLTGRTYQIGSLMCPNTGKAFDVTVITDFHNDEEDGMFEIINFYFGDYDYETTEQYIALTIKPEAIDDNVPATLIDYCQDALNVLCDTQVLEGPMPAAWKGYCATAQHIDPNGDWTNVDYDADTLEALISFYSHQAEEISIEEPTEETTVPVVELSSAQLSLIQAAIDFGISHVKEIYADLDEYISTEYATGYSEELKKISEALMFISADDFDIQIRN